MKDMRLEGFFEGNHRFRVIDVWARGSFHNIFLPLAGKTEIIGFEPEPEEYKRLTSLNHETPWQSVEILPYAVGETKHNRDFYIAKKPALSSLLAPNLSFLGPSWDVRQTIQVDTKGLDALYEKKALSGHFDFLKVDVQGADLEVIRSGSEHILPDLLGIETEASFREHYLTQPFFSEIEIYLRDKGFELLVLAPHHAPPDFNSAIASQLERSRQRVDWCDAVFLRGRSWLRSLNDLRRSRVLPKLAVIYMLYGLFEEAFVLSIEFDPDLSSKILHYYEESSHSNWRWRLGLLKRALRCAVKPSRRYRERLARHTMTHKSGSNDYLWKLIDIHL